MSYEPATPFPLPLPGPSWEELDDAVSRALGRPAVAIPSVRVGMTWLLEDMGLKRNEHEVLVPRFVGRCILDAVGRAAHPVLTPGPRTKAAIVVHSFGRAPNWIKLKPELDRLNLPFFEDAPDALASDEKPAPGSLGKFIALSKFLPMPKGGAFIAGEPRFAELMRRRRAEKGPRWASWWTALMLWHMRRTGSSLAAESAYALYFHAPSDNAALRRLFSIALAGMPERERAQASSLAGTGLRLGRVKAALDSAGAWHVDAADNMLAPDFRTARLEAL